MSASRTLKRQQDRTMSDVMRSLILRWNTAVLGNPSDAVLTH